MSRTRRRLLGTALTATAATLSAGSARIAAGANAPGGVPPMPVLRTPEERFADLAGYDFRPRYVRVGGLRMHYVDERPRPSRWTGETVVLLHGEPAWAYSWREMIRPIVAAGHRCVVPDLLGFGRSDKPVSRADHTYQRHVDWLREAMLRLNLRGVTLVCHDWGGLLGLRLLAEHPGRFRRVVASNTFLPTGDEDLGEAFHAWREYSQLVDPFDSGAIVASGTVTGVDADVQAGYNAPFPDESYLAGPRQFPLLVPIAPDDPAARPNRHAWRVLERLHTPFLCAFGDNDWPIAGGAAGLYDRIPGARGQDHTPLPNAGHFIQEDAAAAMAEVVTRFIRTTR